MKTSSGSVFVEIAVSASIFLKLLGDGGGGGAFSVPILRQVEWETH